MANPSPAPAVLVLVAVGGLALLATTAWLMVSGASERATPRSGPVEPAASDPAPPHDPPHDPSLGLDVDLERRIRDEIARLAEPVDVAVPILDASGAPAANARALALVELTPPPRSPSGATPRLVRAVEGDAPRFEGVPGIWPELALLHASADGVAAQTATRVPLPESGGGLEPLRLSPGAPLRGRVVGAGGEPLSGATVTAWACDVEPAELGAHAAELSLGQATTDGRGEFEVVQLSPRQVRLEATASGRASALVPVAEVGAPIVLRLERAASIGGVVVDGDERPIAGAWIAATMAGPEQRCAGRAVAGADGRFELAALVPSYYVVRAGAPGHAAVTLARAHTDVTALRLVLRKLASARLELLGAPAGVDVPVVWRTVAAHRAGTRPTSAPRLAWMRGRALTIDGIEAGEHALELSVPGAMPLVTPAVIFALDATTELGSFTLRAGATIAVAARAPDGAPLPARVALAAAHHTALADSRDVFTLPDRRERRCDRDGRTSFVGLPPGERALALRHDGFADATLRVTVPESGSVTAEPVTLQPAGTIEGVVESTFGRALAGIAITARRVGGAETSTATDATGRFRLERLEPGRYEVAVVPVAELRSDLAAALAPAANVTKLVDVVAGETRHCELKIELP